MSGTDTNDAMVEIFSQAERERVVRICARLSRSVDAAEDLAQETLLEAWKAQDRLRDSSSRAAWLAGIARNVCLRSSARSIGRARPPMTGLTIRDVEMCVSDDIAIDVQLERSELADVLSRALGLLPVAGRDLLVERYVDDLSVAEIAARRGLSEGTAAVRLHRGKRALKRILQSDLREEAIALGLLSRDSEEWQTTKIWCPLCGGACLTAHSEPAVGTFAVHCPNCRHRTTEKSADYLGQTTGYWRSLQRVYREGHQYYRAALASGSAPCGCCGGLARLRFSIPRSITGLDRDIPGVYIWCEICGAVSQQPDVGLALTHPTVQHFWRDHKRMRLAGRYTTASAGRDATLIRFESLAGTAAVELVAAADNLEVLEVTADGGRGA